MVLKRIKRYCSANRLNTALCCLRHGLIAVLRFLFLLGLSSCNWLGKIGVLTQRSERLGDEVDDVICLLTRVKSAKLVLNIVYWEFVGLSVYRKKITECLTNR